LKEDQTRFGVGGGQEMEDENDYTHGRGGKQYIQLLKGDRKSDMFVGGKKEAGYS